MTPIVKYQCDICKEIYEDYRNALKCEGKGLPCKSKIPPLGTIICTAPNESLYPNFAWVVSYVGSDYYSKHNIYMGVTVFRGNDVGDDDLTEAMGQSGRDTFSGYMDNPIERLPEAFDCPAFRRAVKAVRDLNMEPYVIRDGVVMTLKEANIDL